LIIAVNVQERALVRFFLQEEEGITWLKCTCIRTDFKDPEIEGLSALQHCVVEVRGEKGSEAIALRQPVVFPKPLPLKHGAVEIDSAPLEYDIFLGEGGVYCGTTTEGLNSKTFYEFGRGAEALRSHKCEPLANKYQVEVAIVLEKVSASEVKKGVYVIRIQSPGRDGTEERKKDEARGARLRAIKESWGRNDKAIRKIRTNAKNIENPKFREKAVKLLGEAVEKDPPSAPALPPPKTPEERQRNEAAYKKYMEKLRDFVRDAETVAEKLLALNAKLKEEEEKLSGQKTASRSTPEGKLEDDVKALSAVLYRLADGIRVDTAIIKELPVEDVSSDPKDLKIIGPPKE
jgi:hypothetical protein